MEKYVFETFWFWITSRSETILLFFRKQKFSNLAFTFIAEKKIAQKFTIFFRTPKLRIKNFAKHIISQTSNTKEIRENIVKKIFAEIFLWKEKFSPKKIR